MIMGPTAHRPSDSLLPGPSMRQPRAILHSLMTGLILLAPACAGRKECATCGTVVVAAVGEPSSLLPPLAFETVARDIGDLVYERLADLIPGRATIDDGAYQPALAQKW